MKAVDILNSSMSIPEKIALLAKPKDVKIQEYINNYKGTQAIKDRVHRTDPDKSNDINKIVVNLYKKITDTASYFVFGNDPVLYLKNPDEKNLKLFEKFKLSYEKAKTGTINRKIGKQTLGYSESAEIIYLKDGEVKYQFLSADKENLHPFFDEKGNLDAFTRSYSIEELIDNKVVTVEYYDVYLQDEMQRFRKYNGEIEQVFREIEDENGEVVEKPIQSYKKMPIVYYSVEEPAAYSVIDLLDRFNLIVSTHADVNDYFAFPLLKLIGFPVTEDETDENKDKSKPYKNTPGIIHLDNTTEGGTEIKSDADFLTWTTKPESAIYEMENMERLSRNLTNTPDLSLDNLKNLSKIISGVALKFMFTDAVSQSLDNQDVFFHLARRINIHKELLAEVEANEAIRNLDIGVEFKIPLPENVNEIIENLVNSTMGGILSKSTALEKNPYVDNVEIEQEKLSNEISEAGSLIIDED